MKLLLSAAVATAALMAASAASAQTTPGGHVGASYSWTDIETPFGDAEGDGFTIDGAVAYSLGGTAGIQLDGAYSSAEDADGFDGTVHLFTRNEAFAAGAFVGVGELEDLDAWVVGGEGMFYLPQITLAGSVGFSRAEELETDSWGVNGEVRFFATDNLRIDGGLGWMAVEGPFGDEDDVMTYGIGAETQLPMAPLSLFAGWSHNDFGSGVEADTFSVGVRFTTYGSLRDRDRRGPSFRRQGGFGGSAGTF